MIPNSISGIHRGIIIANNDPEGMGRVKVFVPSVNAAIFEKWFAKDGQEQISFNGIGSNINSYLTPEFLEKLHTLLPWAEVAQPIFGMGAGGKYSAPENRAYLDEKTEEPCPVQQSPSTNDVINSDAKQTREKFNSELQNPSVREKFYALMKAETGGQGEQAQTAFAETVFNRATIQNTSIDKILSNTNYYAPYKNGAFVRAKNSLSQANRNQYDKIITSVQNGSNITNGATHNASGSVAANAVSRFNARPNTVTKIGGETYYSKTFEPVLNFNNNPTDQNPNPIVTPPPHVSSDCTNVPAAPGTSFTDRDQNRQNLPAGGENNQLYPINKDYNKSNKNKKEGFQFETQKALQSVINSLTPGGSQQTQGYMSVKQEQNNKGSVATSSTEGALNTANTTSSNTENADTSPPLIPPNQFSKAKGMISIPSPMSHVWVMFEGGDSNYPIVFGTIFGKEDYQGIHDMTEIPSNSSNVQPGSAPTTDNSATASQTSNVSGSAVNAADAQQKKVKGDSPGGYCYRGVKNALLQGGVVDNYMPGRSAKDAGPTLIQNGFQKTNLTDPRQAPPGSVIVYGGGQHGHIEMKTSDGGYVSDFYSRNPPSTKSRPVLGIYIK